MTPPVPHAWRPETVSPGVHGCGDVPGAFDGGIQVRDDLVAGDDVDHPAMTE